MIDLRVIQNGYTIQFSRGDRMQIRFFFAVLVFSTGCAASAQPLSAEDSLELRDGDRIVFLGNTFIERAQNYGYLETLLAVGGPRRNVTFRNLGWSADNVFGHSRAVFDRPSAGFGKLRKQVVEAKPTVLVIGYGSNAAYAGRKGLDSFLEGYRRLLDALAGTGARIVLLSPIRLENKGPPLPNPGPQNANLAVYVKAIGELAAGRDYLYVNLFKALRAEGPGRALTDNGIHLNARGYRAAARTIAAALGLDVEGVEVRLEARGDAVRASSARNAVVRELKGGAGGVSFSMTRSMLPGFPGGGDAAEVLSIGGLLPGAYALRIDGVEVIKATAATWKVGVAFDRGPDFDRVDKIRRLGVEKNFFYFHRYRPANWPYIYGFRKHEQGNNAVEIPLFDPLIAEKEAEIARLRVPVARSYVLLPASAEKGGSR